MIKSVDRGKWIAVRKILIPLKTSTATAVEAGVACILTEVLDLFIGQQVNVHTVPRIFERLTHEMMRKDNDEHLLTRGT